jgi:hypothetical protein
VIHPKCNHIKVVAGKIDLLERHELSNNTQILEFLTSKKLELIFCGSLKPILQKNKQRASSQVKNCTADGSTCSIQEWGVKDQ